MKEVIGRCYVVPIPLDAVGDGPCNEAAAVRTSWEVWDEGIQWFAVFDTETGARAEANRLNAGGRPR